MAKNKMWIAVLMIATLMPVSQTMAQTSWLEDFYSSAGAAANVTPPRAISNQNIVGYSGGGVSWRYPNKTLTPFQITPPSLKAGCGGIDFYLGAFSFVNKDQFIQALRNMGQAAVGHFFMLALRSMAPEVAATLEVINDLATRANQFGMNSCAAGKALANSAVEELGIGMSEDAKNRYVAVGAAVDTFASGWGLKDANYAGMLQANYEARYAGKSKPAVDRTDIKSNAPPELNLVWWALNESGLSSTDDEMQLAMSMIGASWITKSTNNAGDGAELSAAAIGKTIEFENLAGHSNSPLTPFEVITCDEEVLCLSPHKATHLMKPFAALARDTLDKLYQAALTRTSPTLNSLDEAVIRLSNVPIYRVASMAATGGAMSGVALSMFDELAEYAGMDAAYNFLEMHLRALQKVLSAGIDVKVPKPARQHVPLVEARVVELRKSASAAIGKIYKDKGNPYTKVDQLDRLERAMYTTLNRDLVANVKFSSRH